MAEALADLATGPDTGDSPTPITEIAGPQAADLVAMATLLAARRGHPRKVEEGSVPDDPDAALMAQGELLPGPSHHRRPDLRTVARHHVLMTVRGR